MADLVIAIKATNQTQAAINSLKGGMGDIQKAAASASQQMKAMGESMASIGGKMTVGVTAPILGFAGAAIKAAADNEQLEVSFTTMLGSAEKAKTMMAELSKFAASTPFESPEIQNASKMLLAFGVSAEDIIPTMTNLGDIAAGLNIPLGDMAYLFGTTRAAGRMMTADLNQFTSRGIPMISALAKTMGVAESDVKGLVEAGKVGFPEMEAALQSLTAEGGQFSGLMAAQSQTLAGLFSTFKDTIGLTMTEVGKQIIETFDLKTKLADALVWLEKGKNAILNFAKTQPQLFKLGIMFGVVAAAIGPVLVGLGMLLSAVAPLAPVFALLVSPIGLVVAGLAALIAFDVGGIRTGLLKVLYDLSQYFRWVVEDADSFNDYLTNLPKWMQPAVQAAGRLVDAFMKLDFREIFASIGSAFQGFYDILVQGKEPIGDWSTWIEDMEKGLGGGIAEDVRTVGIALYDMIRVFDTAKDAIMDFVKTGDTDGIKAIGDSIRTTLSNIDPPSLSDVWNAAKLKITTVVSEIDWNVPVNMFNGLKARIFDKLRELFTGEETGKKQDSIFNNTKIRETKGSNGFDVLREYVLGQIKTINWSGAAGGAGKGAANLFDGLKTWAVGQVSTIDWSGMTAGVGKGTRNAFDGIKTWVTGQVSGIDWKTLSDNATVTWGTLVMAVKSGLGAIDWSALVTNATVYFGTLVNSVKGALGAIDWSTLGGVGKGAVSLFSGLLTWVRGQLGSINWSGMAAGAGEGAKNIFDGLKTWVMGQMGTVDWSTLGGEGLTAFQTGASSLKSTLDGLMPIINQILDPETGILPTITHAIGTAIENVSAQIDAIDAEALGEKFGPILGGIALLVGFIANAQLADATVQVQAVISLGTSILNFISGFGAGLDVGIISTAISGFAATFAAQLAAVFTEENTTGLGEAIGTFAGTIVTKIGEFFGQAGFGEEMGEAAGGAASTLAVAAMKIVTGLANQLGTVDWALFVDQIQSFTQGFATAAAAAIGQVDWGPVGKAMVDGVATAVGKMIGGAFPLGMFGPGPESEFGLKNIQRNQIGPVEDPFKEAPSWWDTFKFPEIPAIDSSWWPLIPTAKFAGWPVIATALFAGWPVIKTMLFEGWPTIPTPGWVTDLMSSIRWALGQGGAASGDEPSEPEPKNAVGTSNWRGGLTWVGETGPELVALPRTSRIFSNRESMEMARGDDKSPIIIQQMVVRSDADIYSISYDLDTLKRQRKSRRR